MANHFGLSKNPGFMNSDYYTPPKAKSTHKFSLSDHLKAENEKKRKYLDACLEQRRHFTPFVVSCEGLFGKEATFFMKRHAKKLADKWRRSYSSTIGLLRTRFAINLVRSKHRCIRGARTSLDTVSYQVDWEDGAGLRFFSTLE